MGYTCDELGRGEETSLRVMTGGGDGFTAGQVEGAKGGDADAFELIFNRFRSRLSFWIAVKMGPVLRQRLAVDDVVQETFLQAFSSLDSYEDRGSGSFFRWLIAVAGNRLRDLHKYHGAAKRHPAKEVALGLSPDEPGPTDVVATSSSPSSQAGKKELVTRLLGGMDRLPESLREVISLRALEERTYKEIADSLGKSAATAQVLYCRALQELKHQLGHGSDRQS